MTSIFSRVRGRRLLWIAGSLWVVLLLASHYWRESHPFEPQLGPAQRLVDVPIVGDLAEQVELQEIRIAVTDLNREVAGVPVVFLHGSPGAADNFRRLLKSLPQDRRYLAVDLPGFGASERTLADYSIRTHARLLDALLDQMGLAKVHLVGYSMGGGVALELSRLDPERLESMTLLSSIGVQELELFGDYGVNHAMHGAQLALLWCAFELVPHFGLFDGGMLSVEYARNFYDTDQRPLREALREWDGPLLLLHGREDALAPYAVALESKRLAPQAELKGLSSGHMMVFLQPELLSEPLLGFWRKVEAGEGKVRADASAEELARVRAPFDPALFPPLAGVALFVFVLLVILATLVTEDLTCVAVGALVGQGRAGLALGAAACFAGIFLGDIMLFLAGRFFGRRAVSRAPLKWFLTPARVERSSAWFQNKGVWVIFLSRFLPGARLPTYFAAGLLRTSFLRFAFWFAIAAGLWTPAIVWISSLLSGELSGRVEFLRSNALWALVLTLVLGLLVVRVMVPMLSHRGRRLLLGSWRRKVRWEYWPPWVVYPPVVCAAIWEGIRQRKLLAFTACNRGIPHGGFVGESKSQIMEGFRTAGHRMPAWELVPKGAGQDVLLEALRRLQQRAPVAWPVVVKPDVGQRGDGVVVAHNQEEVVQGAAALPADVILQAFVSGPEYGLFWAHHPDQEQGGLISVVDKRLVRVRGDGRRSLEDLILDDERAVAMAPFFLDRNRRSLARIPVEGEEVAIGELGTHCKGALFLDGRHLITPALTQVLSELAAGFQGEVAGDSGGGFRFGRFDVRCASESALKAGELQIIEVNGVTSEAAHIYDPQHGPMAGWRTLGAQWRLAQRIGAALAHRGAPVSSAHELIRAIWSWRRGT